VRSSSSGFVGVKMAEERKDSRKGYQSSNQMRGRYTYNPLTSSLSWLFPTQTVLERKKLK
jgi:hypothetical protein